MIERLMFLAVGLLMCSPSVGLAQTVLKDCTFEIEPGEYASIVGPSGAGKSTLLNLVATMIVPQSGVASADRCLDDALDWLGGTGTTAPVSPGTTFQPGFLTFDVGDRGVYASVLDVSMGGFPIAAGVLPDELAKLRGRTDIQILLLAFDPMEHDVARDIIGILAPPSTQRVAAAEVIASAAEVATEGPIVDPAVVQLQSPSPMWLGLLDSTGNATFELMCETDPRAIRYRLDDPTRTNVALTQTRGRSGAALTRVDFVIISCPSFWTAIGS